MSIIIIDYFEWIMSIRHNLSHSIPLIVFRIVRAQRVFRIGTVVHLSLIAYW